MMVIIADPMMLLEEIVYQSEGEQEEETVINLKHGGETRGEDDSRSAVQITG